MCDNNYSIWRAIAPLSLVIGNLIGILYEFFGPDYVVFGGGSWVGTVSVLLTSVGTIIYIWLDYPVIKKIVKTRFKSSNFGQRMGRESPPKRGIEGENRAKLSDVIFE